VISENTRAGTNKYHEVRNKTVLQQKGNLNLSTAMLGHEEPLPHR
jgi:hypothetical protein